MAEEEGTELDEEEEEAEKEEDEEDDDDADEEDDADDDAEVAPLSRTLRFGVMRSCASCDSSASCRGLRSTATPRIMGRSWVMWP
ncbi:MAG: hypothetical protein JO299_19055 [Gammaproteobacteria bacterium]|nr:hypothetical protein [Gammaproteobacteria bacterium]